MSGTRAADRLAIMDSMVAAAAARLRARAEDLGDPLDRAGHALRIRGRERLARKVDLVRRQLRHIGSLEGLADSYSREGLLQVAAMEHPMKRHPGSLEAVAVEIAYAARWIELSRGPGTISTPDRTEGPTP